MHQYGIMKFVRFFRTTQYTYLVRVVPSLVECTGKFSDDGGNCNSTHRINANIKWVLLVPQERTAEKFRQVKCTAFFLDFSQLLNVIYKTAKPTSAPKGTWLRSTFFICAMITVRYDTRCYVYVRSKADRSKLNLPHGTKLKSEYKKRNDRKTDMIKVSVRGTRRDRKRNVDILKTLHIDKGITELLRIWLLTYFGHVSRMPAERFSHRLIDCLDVLRHLVQEEDLGRNGWTMSKKIVRLWSCWRQTFLEDIHTTLGLPSREDSVIVAQASSQLESSHR